MKLKTGNGARPRMEVARRQLIESLSEKIKDRRVLEAIARTPREFFVTPEVRELAYEDAPLPIGQGQTISQPLIVAMMLEALELGGEETVLEVGTGSGYQAVLLSQLAWKVVSVERIPELAKKAEERTRALGCKNVRVEVASERLGCPQYAPYQAIIVSAAAPDVPQALVDQLGVGGRMVVPVGSREEQDLKKVVKLEQGLDITSLGGCRFVPLIGREAWEE